MGINNKIDGNSESLSLLENKTFLNLLGKFFSAKLSQMNNEQVSLLSPEHRMAIRYLLEVYSGKNNGESIDKDIIFKFMGDFFSVESNLYLFVGFLQNGRYFNSEKGLNEISAPIDICDYLLDTYKKVKEYPEGIVNQELLLKKKVTEIVGNKEPTSVYLKLLKYGYPIIIGDNEPIVDVDFDDNLKCNNCTYIKVKFGLDSQNYINKEGKILVSRNMETIRDILYQFKFGKIFIMKYINDDLDSNVDILNHGEGTQFQSKDVIDATVKSFINGDKSFEYLLFKIRVRSNQKLSTVLYNDNMKQITLKDFISFLGLSPENNETNLKNTNQNSNILYEDIVLSKIGKKRSYGGKGFIPLDVYIDGELSTGVLNDVGEFLKDKYDLVENLYSLQSIGGVEVLSFGYNNSKQGFIDKEDNVVHIEGKKLLSLEKIILKVDGDDYFKINGKDGFVISEEKLINNLSKYSGFN